MLLLLQVPDGVDWAAVVKNAMDKYSVEIAGGLGPTAGRVWRVGIMVSPKTVPQSFVCMKLESKCFNYWQSSRSGAKFGTRAFRACPFMSICPRCKHC